MTPAEEAVERVRALATAAHLALTFPSADAPDGCLCAAWTLDPAEVLRALGEVAVEHDVTAREIVAALRQTYTVAGVAIWLRGYNRHLGGIPAELFATPDGRAAVLAEAESLTGMVAT